MAQTFTSGYAPGALPGIGHALQLARQPMEFLGGLAHYGDLVEIRLGTDRAQVPCHPELLKQVLRDDRTFDKGGAVIETVSAIGKSGLVTSDHAHHRPMRRALQPVFERSLLSRYSTVMGEETERLFRSWKSGEVIDSFSVFSHLALRIVSHSLFHPSIPTPLLDRLQHAFAGTVAGLGRLVFVPRPLHGLPLPLMRNYRAAVRQLHAAIDEIIALPRAESNRPPGDDTAAEGIVAALLACERAGGPPADPVAIRDQVVTMLMAGTETLSAAFTWALYLLATHPDIQEDVRAEADVILRDRPLTFEDLPHLGHTGRAVKETLRLYSPGLLVTRLTTRDVRLAGRDFRAGTTFVFSPTVIHLRPDLFSDPGRFTPDRWDADKAVPPGRDSFVIFGGGARKCIGDSFALSGLSLVLARLIATYRVTIAPGSDTRHIPLAYFHSPRKLLLRLDARPVAD